MSQRINTRRDLDLVKGILKANAKTRIIELHSLPTNDELKALITRNRPIVLRGVAKEWPLVQRWGNKAILTELARKELEAEPKRKYTIYQPDPDGYLNQGHAAPVSQLSFSRYLDVVENSKKSLYLLGVPDLSGRGASPLEPKIGQETTPVFAADLEISSPHFFFLDLFKNAEAVRRHVFFNSGYSFTNLHFDSDWNTYLCAVGQRRWTLAHPGQARILAHAPQAAYSTLRPAQAALSGRLNRLVTFKQVLLNPGDVLFVPPTWWHVVEGCVDQEPGTWSCGINWFFTIQEALDSSDGEESDWEEVYNIPVSELVKQLTSIAKELKISRRVFADTLDQPLDAKRRRN